jgi:transposase
MPHYVGLDVSQKTTSICVVDEQGRRLWRGVCTTHPDPIATQVLRHAGGSDMPVEMRKLGLRPVR